MTEPRRLSAAWPKSLCALPAPLLARLEQGCAAYGSLCEEVLLSIWLEQPTLFGSAGAELLAQVAPGPARERLRTRIEEALQAVGDARYGAKKLSGEVSPRLRQLAQEPGFQSGEPAVLLTLLGRGSDSLLRRLLPAELSQHLGPAALEHRAPGVYLRIASGPMAGWSAQLLPERPLGIGRRPDQLGLLPCGGLALTDRTISRWEEGSEAPLVLKRLRFPERLHVTVRRGAVHWEHELWEPALAAAPTQVEWDWSSPATLGANCQVAGLLPHGTRSFRYGSTLFVLSVVPEGKVAEAKEKAPAAPKEQPLFCWIHLSDMQFGLGGGRFDQRLVHTMIRRDLEALLSHDTPPPDALLLTGDVAFCGDAAPRSSPTAPGEYAEASEFLHSLCMAVKLQPERVFVVPGNHDVQRSMDRDRRVQRLVSALRQGTESLDQALEDPQDAQLLRSRQANFLAFAANFAPACLTPAGQGAKLWWSHTLQGARGLLVRLIGLNTAILAAGSADAGKLRIGHAALTELAEPPPGPTELLVVLSHHPFRHGWLADEKSCDAWIRRLAHVHLSGHLHDAESEEARSGGAGRLVRVSAGATYEAPGQSEIPASHSYNVASVYLHPDGKTSLRIWPRRWSDRLKEFRPDVDNLPDGQNHTEHQLQLTLSRQSLAP